jgi:hypothetical protein
MSVRDASLVTRREGRGAARLWFGVLTGPVAWAVQLSVNYLIEEWISCTPGSRTPGSILGISTKQWIVTVSVVLALVTVVALLTSIASYLHLRRSDESTGRRSLWMARVGIINSSLFGLPIALAMVSPVLLQTCHSTL